MSAKCLNAFVQQYIESIFLRGTRNANIENCFRFRTSGFVKDIFWAWIESFGCFCTDFGEYIWCKSSILCHFVNNMLFLTCCMYVFIFFYKMKADLKDFEIPLSAPRGVTTFDKKMKNSWKTWTFFLCLNSSVHIDCVHWKLCVQFCLTMEFWVLISFWSISIVNPSLIVTIRFSKNFMVIYQQRIDWKAIGPAGGSVQIFVKIFSQDSFYRAILIPGHIFDLSFL